MKKTKLGEVLTNKARMVANYNRISIQEVARRAINAFNSVGDSPSLETLPASGGTVIDLDGGSYTHGEIRGIVNWYVEKNMPDLTAYWDKIEKELEDLRDYTNQFKQSIKKTQAYIEE